MTGFARLEESRPWGSLVWEIRSVNHRYLEPHFRLPENLRLIETELRNVLRKTLQRGKVEMSLQVQLLNHRDGHFNINRELVAQISHTIQDINDLIDDPANVSPLDILQWPGVIDTESVDMKAIQKTAIASFNNTLKQVVEHRTREGAELKQFIEQRLQLLADEVVKIRAHLPALMQAQKDKMLDRLAALKTEVNQDRLEQELVFYAQKADVDEELDRLDTHVSEVRHVLQQGGAVGRRLDFLMQELNREANTLASKSIATVTSQSAMELKIIIEQMREQIQNIE
jgi:uncharacterized protein (TIGR00255 family)